MGQEYKDRNSSIFRNQITKIDLQTVVVNPTIAFKVNEILSVGAGIDWMYGKAKLAKTPVIPIPGTPNLYNLDLEGDGDAWGYNFGILLKPSANLRIGANYRSPFTLEIKDGDVEIRNINSTVGFIPPGGFTAAQVFGGTSFDTKGSATIKMPATFALGAAYTMGKLTVEADADWTFWHSFRSLPIDIRDNVGALLPDTDAPKNWKDVVALCGSGRSTGSPIRSRFGRGSSTTRSPVPADTMGPELPDADRLNYMVGAGYKVGPWTIDGAFMYIDKFDRTVTNPHGSAAPGPATPGWRVWTSGTSSKLTRGGEGPGGPSPRGIRARRVPFRSAARGSARTP